MCDTSRTRLAFSCPRYDLQHYCRAHQLQLQHLALTALNWDGSPVSPRSAATLAALSKRCWYCCSDISEQADLSTASLRSNGTEEQPPCCLDWEDEVAAQTNQGHLSENRLRIHCMQRREPYCVAPTELLHGYESKRGRKLACGESAVKSATSKESRESESAVCEKLSQRVHPKCRCYPRSYIAHNMNAN